MTKYLCVNCRDLGIVDGKPCPKCRIVIHNQNINYETKRIIFVQ